MVLIQATIYKYFIITDDMRSRSAYLCFLCQKRLCDCLPDTTGSTRYQRHLTSQIHCNGMRAYQFTASINDEVNEAF